MVTQAHRFTPLQDRGPRHGHRLQFGTGCHHGHRPFRSGWANSSVVPGLQPGPNIVVQQEPQTSTETLDCGRAMDRQMVPSHGLGPDISIVPGSTVGPDLFNPRGSDDTWAPT